MMKTIFNYFLRGLLVVFPFFVTGYLIVNIAQWFNNTFNGFFVRWLGINIPGLGIIAVFLSIALLGYLFSRAFIKPIITYFDRFMGRLPLVKIIYTSLKDLTEAFVGDTKRFDKPVLADMSPKGDGSIQKIGFVTQADLSALGLNDMV